MSPVEVANRLAAQFGSWAVSASVVSAAVFLLVALAWLVIRHRASAQVGHLLFLTPLLPLTTPSVWVLDAPDWVPQVAVPGATSRPAVPALTGAPVQAAPVSGAGLQASAGPGATVEQASIHATGAGPLGLEPRVDVRADLLRARPQGSSLSPVAISLIVWALAAAALLARFARNQLDLHRVLDRAPRLEGPEGARVRAAVRRLGPLLDLRAEAEVVTSDAVPGPAVWSLRRPRIVFPAGLAAQLSDDQLDALLLHELAHVRRRDLLVSFVQRAVQLLWFFHPVVWLTGRAAAARREEACDEVAVLHGTVLHGTRGSAVALAEAILRTATFLPPSTRTIPTSFLPRRPTNTPLQMRIQNVLRPTHRRSSRLSAASRVLVVLASLPALVRLCPAQEHAPVESPSPLSRPGVAETTPAIDADAATDAAIVRSLSWLLEQQAADGHWPTGPSTEAETGELTSVGVTGLTLRALLLRADLWAQLDAGAATGRARNAVLGGLRYLEGLQQESGLFGEATGSRFMQSHAVATLAWIEGAPYLDDEPRSKAVTERAVAVILGARNPYGGWRFSLEPRGDQDPITTATMLETLRAARTAGVEFPDSDWRSPMLLLKELTSEESGRTGYFDRGDRDPRLPGKRAGFPPEATELCTASALGARLEWGESPDAAAPLARAAELLGRSRPTWDLEAGRVDFYYWLAGTRALRQMEGDHLARWSEDLRDALLPNQVRLPHTSPDDAGIERGYWPAVDAWSTEGTSVHSTALCTLALALSSPAAVKKD